MKPTIKIPKTSKIVKVWQVLARHPWAVLIAIAGSPALVLTMMNFVSDKLDEFSMTPAQLIVFKKQIAEQAKVSLAKSVVGRAEIEGSTAVSQTHPDALTQNFQKVRNLEQLTCSVISQANKNSTEFRLALYPNSTVEMYWAAENPTSEVPIQRVSTLFSGTWALGRGGAAVIFTNVIFSSTDVEASALIAQSGLNHRSPSWIENSLLLHVKDSSLTGTSTYETTRRKTIRQFSCS